MFIAEKKITNVWVMMMCDWCLCNASSWYIGWYIFQWLNQRTWAKLTVVIVNQLCAFSNFHLHIICSLGNNVLLGRLMIGLIEKLITR